MTEFSNDNGVPGTLMDAREQDAYGHAALLLVESVLHGLIEQSIFSVEQAVDLVDTAISIRSEVVVETGDSSPMVQRSLGLLEAISTSLQSDRRS